MHVTAIHMQVETERRYTVENFHKDAGRYHPRRFFVVGHLGAIEVPRQLVPEVVQDGITSPGSRDRPRATSPYVLLVPHEGIGILAANPSGPRRPDGTCGAVLIKPTPIQW